MYTCARSLLQFVVLLMGNNNVHQLLRKLIFIILIQMYSLISYNNKINHVL